MNIFNYRENGWWTDQGLWDRYLGHAARNSDQLAVADDTGAELTHAGLLAAANRVSGQLVEAGVKAGDLVLEIMPNCIEWQVVFAAILRLGAVPMTVPVTTDAKTLAYLCDLTEVAAIVTVNEFGNTKLEKIATDAVQKAKVSPAVMTINSVDTIEVVDAGAHTTRSIPLDGVAHVMTTSSTTGMPKAVTHSENTLEALNHGFAERFGLSSTTPLLMVSPLGHSVGAIHGARLAMYLGAPLILQQRWEPSDAIELAQRYNCEFTSLATPFLKDLIDAPALPEGSPAKLATIRNLLCGGAAVPPLLMDQAAEQFPNTFVTVLWGMTEGGVTTCTPTSTDDQQRNTAGCGLPGLELSIVDAALNHLPTGEVGELVMRGPGVFTGYLGQDDLYRDSLTADGFFRTGDLAFLDDDNYLHLTGRLKDLIIRGGVNISPVLIEDALAGHPDVRRVAVVGQPDDRLGERLCAVVIPQPGQSVSLEDLVNWASEHGLSRRYWPESIQIVDDMPVTAAGKIRKNQLRDDLFGS